MKKSALICCYLCFCTLHLRAQLTQGAWLFSPLTMARAWSAPNDDDISERGNYVSFKAHYFPARRLGMGGQFQYHGYRASENYRRLEEKISWWLMPTLRYYLSDPDSAKPLKTFAEAGGSIFYNVYQYGTDIKSWGGIASLGVNYFLSDYLSLEVIAGLLYRQVREEISPINLEHYTSYDPNMQVAMRFFLGPGPADAPVIDQKKTRWLVGAWMDLDSDDDGVLNRHPFFLRSRAAYFPVPHVAIGLEGGVDLGGNDLFSLTIGACREGGFFGRYYLPTAGRTCFFPELGYSLSRNIYEGFYSSKAKSLHTGLGASTFLNDRFALETLLRYRRFQFDQEAGGQITLWQNSLRLEISLVYFVPRKKTSV